jgi:hypothetical protein
MQAWSKRLLRKWRHPVEREHVVQAASLQTIGSANAVESAMSLLRTMCMLPKFDCHSAHVKTRERSAECE